MELIYYVHSFSMHVLSSLNCSCGETNWPYLIFVQFSPVIQSRPTLRPHGCKGKKAGWQSFQTKERKTFFQLIFLYVKLPNCNERKFCKVTDTSTEKVKTKVIETQKIFHQMPVLWLVSSFFNQDFSGKSVLLLLLSRFSHVSLLPSQK